ncbi:MAG TPA: PH domain-containing protein [Xanthobacteraceae bacterium]|nr:PH domain-containing protein [Xanthobacteraceae bacterium]
MLTSRDWVAIPFSLVWCGFAIFWEANALATNGPIFMKLWGVPFVLIGLYVLVGRFLLDARIRRDVYYAVTDKRVLILRSGLFSKFSALSLDQLPDATLSESAGGRGSIRFGTAAGGGSNFSGWTPSLDSTPQFLAIENARTVFDQIQQGIAKRA